MKWPTWRPTPTAFSALPPRARWDDSLRPAVPIAFAVSTGIQITKYLTTPEWVGFDARLYVDAARAWLQGSNPWLTTSHGIPFGAAPPTLLVMVPFTPLSDPMVSATWILGSFGLAALAVRSLGLEWWWIVFWPIVDGILSGNPDIAVLALLVVGGRRLDALAPVLKIYAVLPLLSERRWVSLGFFALIVIATSPVLPWSLWLQALPMTVDAFEGLAGSTSVTYEPLLVVLGVAGLVALGFRRAGWLAVPLLWPWTQAHYLAMSVPALTATLAILWSIPGPPPIVMLGSILIAALGVRLFPEAKPPSAVGGAIEPITSVAAPSRFSLDVDEVS